MSLFFLNICVGYAPSNFICINHFVRRSNIDYFFGIKTKVIHLNCHFFLENVNQKHSKCNEGEHNRLEKTASTIADELNVKVATVRKIVRQFRTSGKMKAKR